jgi:hypothetical protein
LRQHRKNELKSAAGLKSPVREITMQASTQAEGIQQAKAHARKPVDQSRAGEDGDNWQGMQTNNEEEECHLPAFQSFGHSLMWSSCDTVEGCGHSGPLGF